LNIVNKKSNRIFNKIDPSKISVPQKVKELLGDEISTTNVNNTKETALTAVLKFIYSYTIRHKGNSLEVLYLIRPLLYLSSMTYFGKKSIYPLIISAVIDIATMTYKRNTNKFTQSKVYFFESSFRISSLSVYLLREPIFSLITKPYLLKLLKILRIPQTIVNLVLDLLTYYTNIYFIL
jgi:hypothetical protein